MQSIPGLYFQNLNFFTPDFLWMKPYFMIISILFFIEKKLLGLRRQGEIFVVQPGPIVLPALLQQPRLLRLPGSQTLDQSTLSFYQTSRTQTENTTKDYTR